MKRTAGDLLLKAVDEWFAHLRVCRAEEACAACDVAFNRARLAHKVFESSRHKAPSPRCSTPVPHTELVAFAREKAAAARDHVTRRGEMAAVERTGTDAEWREAAAMASRQAGRDVPVSTPEQREASAKTHDAIAAKYTAEAERYEQIAAALERSLGTEVRS